MQNAAQVNTIKKNCDNKKMEPENGLINLVKYYQNMFDKEENILYYSPENYQNAKRKFVKYSLKNRSI